MKKIYIILCTALIMGLCGCCSTAAPVTSAVETIEITQEKSPGALNRSLQNGPIKLSTDQLCALLDNAIIRGVQDSVVECGTAPDWSEFTAVDGVIVKSLEYDDSMVDYSTKGIYPLTYTLVLDGTALKKYEEETGIPLNITDSEGEIEAIAEVEIKVIAPEN